MFPEVNAAQQLGVDSSAGPEETDGGLGVQQPRDPLQTVGGKILQLQTAEDCRLLFPDGLPTLSEKMLEIFPVDSFSSPLPCNTFE